jgi:hypothetical protein
MSAKIPRTVRVGTAVLLGVVLAAAGCTGGGGSSGGGGGGQPASQAASGAGGGERVDLKGVCPDPVVVQTDWYPETEYGVLYHLIGPNPQVDTGHKIVRGELVDQGRDTGIKIEVRSGGPATGFKLVSEQMYNDKSITIGQVNTDEAIRFAAQQPTYAVVAPMEISPFMILWDPQTHPEFNIIADLGQSDVTVRYFKGDTYMEYLVGSGILRRNQLDDKYDGSSQPFFDGKGKIAQAGFATSEPYIYEHDPKWGKKVNYGLINDTGYPFYPQAISIRPADKAKLAPCLKQLVPIIQRAQVDFLANPDKTNAFVIGLVKQYHDPAWDYDPGLAAYAIRQMRLNFVNNGDDATLGNFEVGRIQRMIDIVTPILAGQRAELKPGLKPSDLYTNEFIDPSIGVRAS